MGGRRQRLPRGRRGRDWGMKLVGNVEGRCCGVWRSGMRRRRLTWAEEGGSPNPQGEMDRYSHLDRSWLFGSARLESIAASITWLRLVGGAYIDLINDGLLMRCEMASSLGGWEDRSVCQPKQRGTLPLPRGNTFAVSFIINTTTRDAWTGSGVGFGYARSRNRSD